MRIIQKYIYAVRDDSYASNETIYFHSDSLRDSNNKRNINSRNNNNKKKQEEQQQQARKHCQFNLTIKLLILLAQ